MTTLEDLERQSRYCDCPELAELNKLGRELKKLETKCKFFQQESPEEPTEADRGFLEDYAKKGRELEGRAEEYGERLTELLGQGKLYRKKSRKNISTIHCLRCDQQIAVLV